jgi:hypothetical protein
VKAASTVCRGVKLRLKGKGSSPLTILWATLLSRASRAGPPLASLSWEEERYTVRETCWKWAGGREGAEEGGARCCMAVCGASARDLGQRRDEGELKLLSWEKLQVQAHEVCTKQL